MDFFDRQDKARKKTKVLVLYFSLAVITTVLLVNLLFFGLWYYYGAVGRPWTEWFSMPFWIYCTLGTMGLIGIGSGTRMAQLSGGGGKVALMAGGRRVDPHTSDAAERRYMNIVEEMSIASGIPVPDIFVLDREDGINAFAAGYNPTEAAIAVTRGALETLNRDELQGVIGHEFSHILNGDMRINVRLIGILAGIVIISQIGCFLLRTGMYGSSRRSTFTARSKSEKGGNPLPLIGLALFVIGYVGLFFGRLIKAAISRQREHLADASAVQFTRNPSGIAHAFVKIKHGGTGSLLADSHAEEMSHMCFGDTVHYRLSGLFSTHPPIDERIKAVSPIVYHEMVDAEKSGEVDKMAMAGPGLEATAGFTGGGAAAAVSAQETVRSSPEALADTVGNPTEAHFAYAESLHASMPAQLLTALRDPDGARAGIFALLLSDDSGGMSPGLEYLTRKEGAKIAGHAGMLHEVVMPLGEAARLPVVDIALPALRNLPSTEVERFMDTTLALVKLDEKVTLFEYALLTILKSQLTSKGRASYRSRYGSIWGVEAEARAVLSAFARVGASDDALAGSAYEASLKRLGLKTTTAPMAMGQAVGLLEPSLDKLVQLAPPIKKKLIAACADCIIHDGAVEVSEGELLRAVCERLDCPMPPIVPDGAA
jgi:Zn-dependent protease with chaperone function